MFTGLPDLQFDIAAYQAGDPDPSDTGRGPAETNPYGLAVLPNGDAVFTDAANNDVVRVTTAGVATTIARFGLETVSTDHLPPGEPDPLTPTIDAEAVPTGIAVGNDGAIYVGELQGFPFRPGTSDVWRIAPGAEGVECTIGVVDPGCALYQEDFTAIQDIAVTDHSEKLYVYELAAEGVLAFEAGFDTGDFPAAVLLRVNGEIRHELAQGQLSEPGGVSIDNDGHVYVTDHVFTPFGGRLIRIQH